MTQARVEEMADSAEVMAPREFPRVLGCLRGQQPGPTLICVGGLHGNEPAGVLGIQRVFAELASGGYELRGEFRALAGNLSALAVGKRFLSRDLNRAWTADGMASIRGANGMRAKAVTSEDQEQRELWLAIEAAIGEARGGVCVLDLHTTSGCGGTFSTVADTLRNRAFALALPVPMVLGLEELVDGTLLEFLGRRGYATAVFEGGQHGEVRAIDRHAAAVWIALDAAGVLVECPAEVHDARRLLAADTRGLPRALEMRHRHHVDSEDGFTMLPGFENFQTVAEGEVLATDRRGEVRSPEGARILMPLYQEQGDDGFFIVKAFTPFWLRVSWVLRRLKVNRFVHWLPGVSRHPTRTGALVANRRVARWFAMELFHLLGYRKHLEEEERLVVDRRLRDD